MAAGVCLGLYHMAAELPRVMAQRIEENEVQVIEFQSEVELLVVEREVEFLVVLVLGIVWLLVVVSGEFLVECLDFLRGERKNVDQFQKELCQVLILLMLWVLDFGIWCGIS